MRNKEIVAEIIEHLQGVMNLMKTLKNDEICGIHYSALEKDKMEIWLYEDTVSNEYPMKRTQNEYFDEFSCKVGDIELIQHVIK